MSPAYGDGALIAALATAPGISALSVIRTSGPGAIDRLAEVFSQPRRLKAAPGNTVVYGWIVHQGKRIDETLVSVYRAPRSYTGEEGADISCHGGSAAAQGVLRALRAAGFRDALPGEFTFRAFMNRKLDLTKAESVMELVSAKTDSGRDHAVRRLSGTLWEEIQGIKSLLVEVLAGTELFLDYSEDEFSADDAETDGRLPNRAHAEDARAGLERLSRSYGLERLYQDGALAVIAGQPNAGKSSLFNLLLKEDRSIVTDIPGTTRDWIEAWISLEGIPIRLADTAGLREDSGDRVEQLGVARARELLEEADMVLYLVDGTQGVTPGDAAFFRAYPDQNRIVLWNKVDEAALPRDRAEFLGVSAKTGAGLPELSAALVSRLGAAAVDDRGGSAPGIATERQKALVDTARASLEEALALADRGEALDVIAPLLREAVNALGELTGEVSTADILEVMFGKFCVGK